MRLRGGRAPQHGYAAGRSTVVLAGTGCWHRYGASPAWRGGVRVPAQAAMVCRMRGEAGPVAAVLKFTLRHAINTGFFLCRKLYFLLCGSGIFNINKLFDFHQLTAKINLGLQQCGGGGPGRGGGGLAIAADYKAI